MPSPHGLLEALEALWGLGPRLSPSHSGALVWIERPWGFRVVEVGPRESGSGWRLFLIRSVGVDSVKAVALVAEELGARGFRLSGLKDACSVSYQYASLRGGRVGRVKISLGGPRVVEAYPLGVSGALRPGSHAGNTFRLAVTIASGDASELCERLRRLNRIPGYYGPQRFGVERPNTHYLGLLEAWGEAGAILREYSRRYPLEPARPPGPYEARALREARAAGSPWAASGRRWIRGFALEALRSYLFNRTLSEALAEGGPEGYAEHWVSVPCPGRGEVRVPAARLPGRGLGARSRWARLAWRVAEEEGLGWAVARLWRAGPFRPLVFPVCRSWCQPAGGGVEWLLTLPRGAYATVALREAAVVDWVEYGTCRMPPPREANG